MIENLNTILEADTTDGDQLAFPSMMMFCLCTRDSEKLSLPINEVANCKLKTQNGGSTTAVVAVC